MCWKVNIKIYIFVVEKGRFSFVELSHIDTRAKRRGEGDPTRSSDCGGYLAVWCCGQPQTRWYSPGKGQEQVQKPYSEQLGLRNHPKRAIADPRSPDLRNHSRSYPRRGTSRVVCTWGSWPTSGDPCSLAVRAPQSPQGTNMDTQVARNRYYTVIFPCAR